MGEIWQHMPWMSKRRCVGLHVDMNARLLLVAFERNTGQRHQMHKPVIFNPYGFLRIMF